MDPLLLPIVFATILADTSVAVSSLLAAASLMLTGRGVDATIILVVIARGGGSTAILRAANR